VRDTLPPERERTKSIPRPGTRRRSWPPAIRPWARGRSCDVGRGPHEEMVGRKRARPYSALMNRPPLGGHPLHEPIEITMNRHARGVGHPGILVAGPGRPL